MFAYETTFCSSKLIRDTALYLGIFDYTSSANRPGKWDALFQDARRKAGRQKWQALFHLNGSWIDFAREGHLLSWITLFHGVFKVEIKLLSENPQIEFEESETKRFLGEGKRNRLYCPSGKIIVASLEDLGKNSIVPLATIQPGWYKVEFFCDDNKESEHSFLEDESQYPVDDGPDWIIYMQRES